jgi:hypothetical protein
MKKTILLCCFCLSIVSAKAQIVSDRGAILKILDSQVTAWNTGNTQQFMVGYWESDSLMYIGKRGITYGYQPTLENYKKNYPDKAAMGTLKFDILKMKPLGTNFFMVIGKFYLTRPEKGDASGHFSLIFEKIKGKWNIIADHSS